MNYSFFISKVTKNVLDYVSNFSRLTFILISTLGGFILTIPIIIIKYSINDQTTGFISKNFIFELFIALLLAPFIETLIYFYIPYWISHKLKMKKR